MNNTAVNIAPQDARRDWEADARELARRFGERAASHDENGTFVHDNYADLAEGRFFSAGIPAELGGGGATFAELCGIVRQVGQQCASTALSFAMHSHTIGANVFRHLRGDEAAGETLAKLAAGEIVIATTGANDWLESSGEAVRVEGGYRITARKHFVSGSPGAAMLVTSTTYDGDEGREVLHFAIPFAAEGVEIVETWRTLGMRGTGSHDVAINDAFVPDAAVVARRPAGQWHPMWEVVLPTALPLISAAYVGLAEAASKFAIESAKRRPAELAGIVGEMTNALTTAQIALADMVRLNDNHGFTPSLQLASDILARKAIIAAAVKQVVEVAAELVGGPGFFRGHAMERIVRDVRAMHFHPLPIRRQQLFSGRLAVGLDPVMID